MRRSACFVSFAILILLCDGYEARIIENHPRKQHPLRTPKSVRFFGESSRSWLRPKAQRMRATLANDSNSNDQKDGFLSSASNTVVAVVAALGFIGGVVVAVTFLFSFVLLCRYFGCKQLECYGFSVNKSKSESADAHPTPESKRSTSTSSSTTSTLYASPLPRRKLPSTLNRSDESESNTNDSKSILSFLESAGRAYNALNGFNEKGSNRTIDGGKCTAKVNVDIAGMSIDSSDLVQSNSVFRLGGGQYNRDGSITSLPTMSDMYPDDEVEIVS